MPNKQEIEKAINDLHDAMIESIEAGKEEDNAKKRKISAHYRLSLARDTVRSLNFN